MKIEFQDRIDDYLLDRMSDEERKSFESDAAEDAELEEQLKFTEIVIRATKSRNEKLAAMAEWKDDYAWEDGRVAASPASSASPVRRIFYWVSGIAAVFVVGFFLIQNLSVGESNSLGNSQSPGVDGVALRDGSDNSYIKLLLMQGNYKEALELIEEEYLAVKEDSLEIVHDLVSILCQSALAVKEDSLEIVHDGSIDAEQKEYDMQIVKDKQDELKWLKAHALLGLSQQETALRILDELRKEEGYYQMAADSLYNNIKK